MAKSLTAEGVSSLFYKISNVGWRAMKTPGNIKRFSWPVIVLVPFLVAACSNGNNLLQSPLTTGAIGQIPKGFDCPLNASNLYPVGAVYRKDANGVHYNVKDLSNTDLIKTNLRRNVKIADYEINDTQKSSAEASATLLKKVVPGLSLSGKGEKRKSLSIDITVKDMRANDIDDAGEDQVVKWLKSNIRLKPGSRYYLVRQAVKAKSVVYVIKKQDLAKIGSKAEFEKAANGAANLTIKDNDGSLKLEQSFDPRITVCTKSAEITAALAVKTGG